jgi:hypothetical protein
MNNFLEFKNKVKEIYNASKQITDGLLAQSIP